MTTLAPWLGGALVLGGIAAALSGRREFMIRWCAWAAAVPLLAAAFWAGPYATSAVAIVAGVVGSAEFGSLLRMPWGDRAVLAGAVTATVLAAWLEPGHLPRVLGICLLVMALVPLLSGDATDGLRRLSAGALGLAWLGLLAAVTPLGDSAFVLFVAVSVGDLVAYFAGPRLGGPHLSPLSPAKRWSGAVAGAVAGTAVLALVSAASWPMVLAVALGAPLGDLLESMIKRGAGQKDSGSWLAGQGGLLDRIDSLLLALGVLVILQW